MVMKNIYYSLLNSSDNLFNILLKGAEDYLLFIGKSYLKDISYSRLLDLTTEYGLRTNSSFSLEEYSAYKELLVKLYDNNRVELDYLVTLNRSLISKDELDMLGNYIFYKKQLLSTCFKREGDYLLFYRKLNDKNNNYSSEQLNILLYKIRNRCNISDSFENSLYNIYTNDLSSDFFVVHIDTLFDIEKNVLPLLVQRSKLIEDYFFCDNGLWNLVFNDIQLKIKSQFIVDLPNFEFNNIILTNFNEMFYFIFDFINNVVMFDTFIKKVSTYLSSQYVDNIREQLLNIYGLSNLSVDDWYYLQMYNSVYNKLSVDLHLLDFYILKYEEFSKAELVNYKSDYMYEIINFHLDINLLSSVNLQLQNDLVTKYYISFCNFYETLFTYTNYINYCVSETVVNYVKTIGLKQKHFYNCASDIRLKTDYISLISNFINELTRTETVNLTLSLIVKSIKNIITQVYMPIFAYKSLEYIIYLFIFLGIIVIFLFFIFYIKYLYTSGRYIYLGIFFYVFLYYKFSILVLLITLSSLVLIYILFIIYVIFFGYLFFIHIVYNLNFLFQLCYYFISNTIFFFKIYLVTSWEAFDYYYFKEYGIFYNRVLSFYTHFIVLLLFGIFINNREKYVVESVGFQLLMDNSHLSFLILVLLYLVLVYGYLFYIYNLCNLDDGFKDWVLIIHLYVNFGIRLIRYKIYFLFFFLIFLFSMRELVMLEDYFLPATEYLYTRQFKFNMFIFERKLTYYRKLNFALGIIEYLFDYNNMVLFDNDLLYIMDWLRPKYLNGLSDEFMIRYYIYDTFKMHLSGFSDMRCILENQIGPVFFGGHRGFFALLLFEYVNGDDFIPEGIDYIQGEWIQPLKQNKWFAGLPRIETFSVWNSLANLRIWEFILVGFIFPDNDELKEDLSLCLELFYNNILLGIIDNMLPGWRVNDYGSHVGMLRAFDAVYYKWYPELLGWEHVELMKKKNYYFDFDPERMRGGIYEPVPEWSMPNNRLYMDIFSMPGTNYWQSLKDLYLYPIMDPEVFKGNGIRDKDCILDLIMRNKRYCLNKNEEEYYDKITIERSKEYEYRYKAQWNWAMKEADLSTKGQAALAQGYSWLKASSIEHITTTDIQEVDTFWETGKPFHNKILSEKAKAELEYEEKMEVVKKRVYYFRTILENGRDKYGVSLRIRNSYK